MADPFQDVDAAGPEFIKMFADAMDVRQSDPTMERIVASYLKRLSFATDSVTIEVGAGAGAVTRRIAEAAYPEKVVGYEPSQGFVDEAMDRSSSHSNLSFIRADGSKLSLENNSVDSVIMHTVLTHVTKPGTLLAEASRVLKTGGTLVVCDADFSKATFSNIPNDPLNICAQEFVREFVTDAFIVGKLRGLITDAGMELQSFDVDSRVVTTREQMRPWVEATTANMVERGDISKDLAEALLAEHDRRADAGSLYGYQAFATATAQKLE